MAQKVVSVSLQARVDGFVSGMRKAKSSVDDLTKASDKMTKQDAFEKLSNKAAIAGLGVATAVGVAVKRFADFDQSMSAVAANSGATGKSLDALRDAAVEMGAASQFSAKEAADGINELAKAGVATEDILNGGLKGALDLAAAGQIGVAQAAETTASALNQFGLEGSKSVHVADLLSNAANAAQGGVGDMAAALGQAGVAANAAGLNIDETTTTLALFAKAGLVGSDAGTSLKTMMQRLSAPTDAAASEMERLGIAAYDSTGEFIGQEAVMEQLASATADLSTESRMAAFNTIFGADAIRAASIAADAGAAGYAAMSAEVTKAGGAAATAAKLTDNLKGDVERLGGALDSAFIQTGSGANSSLRDLAQALTGVVEMVAKIPGPLLLAGGAVTSFGLLAPKAISAWQDYSGALEELGLSVEQISEKSPAAGKALEKLEDSAQVVAVAAVAVGIREMIAAASIATVEVDDLAESLEELGESRILQGGIADLFRDEGGWVQQREEVVTLTEAVERFGIVADDALGGGVVNNLERWSGSDALPKFEKQVTQLDGALAAMVAAGNADAAAEALAQLLSGVAPENVDKVRAAFVLYDGALESTSTAASAAADSSGLMAGATGELEGAAEDAEKALSDLKDAIEGLGSPVAAQRAATNTYESAIDTATEALIEQKDALVKSRLESQGITDATKKQQAAAEAWATAQMKTNDLLDESTEAGRTNRANLDAIRTATLEKVTADYALNESTKGTTAATAIATATMQAGRDAFVAAAIAAGATKDEANALATQLGLIPDEVGIAVSQTGATDAGRAIDEAARDRFATIWVNKVIGRRTTDLSSEYQGVGGLATGGAVRGPGTGTSDSILTRLSNGEHVLTAAEVARMGGQSAVYALRSAIRQGRIPKYATGGAVMSTSRFAPPSYAGPSMSTHTESHEAPINVAAVYTTNWADLERQAESRRRLENLGRRRA